VRAKARFANADGALFPNQFVNARLLGTAAGVLVPVTAVRTGRRATTCTWWTTSASPTCGP
jgi:hypothetical protein